ncbi:TPA: hypothetical protein ACP7Q5_004912 [Escherichia coli]|jgi:signal transduction histidine kinase|uniref:Uncharacterized protein n=4 Tax=root TaxID=1 RepID=A0A8S5UI75_9CAUD|nr:hypothetical protein [Enterococcus faecalis]ELG7156170.1 hypothetical protein [Staphylococcus aureus]DAF94131.1 MAG TPA: hypothetical protein [Myoviridae sp. ctu2j3]HDH7257966.1 hypothetical protein [Escherichia coli]ELL1201043.1 hypothetical protein [Staphylococcus aureus]MDN3123466.1 hypothetical protein [Enterococcus faecalis]
MGHPLEVSVAALKALVADYALRTQQAELLTSRLIDSNLDDAAKIALFEVVQKQLEARAHDRAVHQQAVLEATCFALDAALAQDDEGLRETIVAIYRDLTTAVSSLTRVPVSSTDSK